LKTIASELANIGDLNQVLAIMNEAFECTHTIDFDELKIETLKEIVTQLTKFGMQTVAIDYTHKISDDFIRNVVLVGIGAELFIQGKYDQSKLIMNEAIDSACDISTYFGESMALKNIAVELYNQGKADEASLIMKNAINSVSDLDYDDDSKSRAIQEIASAFAKKSKIDEAIETANGIYYNKSKSEALSDIATELAKQGKIEDAMQCALDIIDLVYRNIAYGKIGSEIAMQGQWQWLQHIGNKVTTTADRQKIWKSIASALVQYGGSNTALQKVKYLPKGEITYSYLQQWVTELFVTDFQKKVTKKALNLLKVNIPGTQSFLQVYAQRELFFGNISANKIDRLNKTLNIQWAIDLKKNIIN
jgi:tetratricopeptide (TPR) repeat protein